MIFLPLTNITSAFFGMLARTPLVWPLNSLIIKLYIYIYKVDIYFCQKTVDEYKTFLDFFTRRLQKQARPIGKGIISPVDGVLRDIGQVKQDLKLAIKGFQYNLQTLFYFKELADSYVNSLFFNLYLSPKDYHFVHSPITGIITKAYYIPGKLFPVNDYFLNKVANIFAINERVLIEIEGNGIKIVLVLVGALNVGQIKLLFTNFKSNILVNNRYCQKIEFSPTKVKKGEEIAVFNLGSTVLMFCDCSRERQISASSLAGEVLMGQQLA